jgi:hypothetical protein
MADDLDGELKAYQDGLAARRNFQLLWDKVVEESIKPRLAAAARKFESQEGIGIDAVYDGDDILLRVVRLDGTSAELRYAPLPGAPVISNVTMSITIWRKITQVKSLGILDITPDLVDRHVKRFISEALLSGK